MWYVYYIQLLSIQYIGTLLTITNGTDEPKKALLLRASWEFDGEGSEQDGGGSTVGEARWRSTAGHVIPGAINFPFQASN